MYNVYLKVYYRPGTDIVVAFIHDYTDKKYSIKKKIQGIYVDKLFVPASAEVKFENNFKGIIRSGSEECRFCSGNKDHFFKMYLLASLPQEFQALDYVKNLGKRLKKSDLYLR